MANISGNDLGTPKLKPAPVIVRPNIPIEDIILRQRLQREGNEPFVLTIGDIVVRANDGKLEMVMTNPVVDDTVIATFTPDDECTHVTDDPIKVVDQLFHELLPLFANQL